MGKLIILRYEGWLWMSEWSGSSVHLQVNGLISGPFHLYADVHLEKTFNPKLFLMDVQHTCTCAGVGNPVENYTA